MPKLKTNKSVAKRVRVTKNGKIIRNRPGRRHILTKKSGKTKRQLRRKALVSPGLSQKFIDVLA